MNGLLDWGVEVVLLLQKASPQLDAFFAFFTFLGDEEFYLLLFPLIYWSVNRAVGVRLMVVFLLSGLVNQVAKHLAAQPRPFQYDSRVKEIVRGEGFGLPSGHTQSAIVVWGYLGTAVRKRWFWVLAGMLMVLTPLSRIYLGVHFPTDVLGGYVLGIAVLWLWLRYGTRLEGWFFEQETIHQLILITAIPALAMAAWPTEDMVTGGGTMVGIGAGLVLERRLVGFDVAGPFAQRALRFLLGIVILAGLWLGLRAAFDGLEPANILRLIRYSLVGLWGALGAPWAFLKLGLAGREADFVPKPITW
ncbi:MAG: phosphatase PAP2 family protein [Acidimicrobiia bacterium]